MGRAQQTYEKEHKIQAVKLAKEIGTEKAANELGIPTSTLYGWLKAVQEGCLDAGPGMRTPESTMRLAKELSALRKQAKALDEENRRLKEEHEALMEASAFLRHRPSEVSKRQRMEFLVQKMSGGDEKRKLAMYCRILGVSRQGYYKHIRS